MRSFSGCLWRVSGFFDGSGCRGECRLPRRCPCFTGPSPTPCVSPRVRPGSSEVGARDRNADFSGTVDHWQGRMAIRAFIHQEMQSPAPADCPLPSRPAVFGARPGAFRGRQSATPARKPCVQRNLRSVQHCCRRRHLVYGGSWPNTANPDSNTGRKLKGMQGTLPGVSLAGSSPPAAATRATVPSGRYRRTAVGRHGLPATPAPS